MKLVIWPAVEGERLARIVRAARPMRVANARSEEEAAVEAADAEAFFGKMTPGILRGARRLAWIQAATASLEHYVFPELVKHPAVLTNMRGIYSDVIADHVMGMILAFARNIHKYIRNQVAGRWAPVGSEAERSTFAAGPGTVSGMDRACMHLADAVLGVVGMGGIGSEVARRGAAFGMRVVGVDPVSRDLAGVGTRPSPTQGVPPQGDPPGVGTRPSPTQGVPPSGVPPSGVAPTAAIEVWGLEGLAEMLGRADFVVIAAPHTPETEKMFRREQFRRMKRSAYLINVGRGAIVDLADLTAALEAGEIAGAGLDVFEVEPLPAGHALWKMENVILTPHVAGCSPRIAERHAGVLLENVRRFVAGEELVNVVDKEKWF